MGIESVGRVSRVGEVREVYMRIENVVKLRGRWGGWVGGRQQGPCRRWRWDGYRVHGWVSRVSVVDEYVSVHGD